MPDLPGLRADSSEWTALLRAVGGACRSNRADDHRGVPGSGLDWGAIVALAVDHGVWPQLCQAVTRSRWDIGHDCLGWLQESIVRLTALNLARVSQLSHLVESLHSFGTPALTFKGPALAVAAYGNIAMRSFIDLDVLVPFDSHRAAAALMKQLGYRMYAPSQRPFVVYPRAGKELAFVPIDTSLAPVDVHTVTTLWALAIRLDTSGLFERSIVLDLAGQRIRTVAPEDHMLVVAAHGALNRWRSLSLVADLAALVPSVRDWTELVHRAEVARMRRVLEIGLMLTATLLASPVPDFILTQCRRDSMAVAVAADCANQLQQPVRRPDRGFNRIRYRMALRERLTDKVRYLARTPAFRAICAAGSVVARPAR